MISVERAIFRVRNKLELKLLVDKKPGFFIHCSLPAVVRPLWHGPSTFELVVIVKMDQFVTVSRPFEIYIRFCTCELLTWQMTC